MVNICIILLNNDKIITLDLHTITFGNTIYHIHQSDSTIQRHLGLSAMMHITGQIDKSCAQIHAITIVCTVLSY